MALCISLLVEGIKALIFKAHKEPDNYLNLNPLIISDWKTMSIEMNHIFIKCYLDITWFLIMHSLSKGLLIQYFVF